MQKIKIEIQEEVQALLKEVQENVKGYNVHLGGGYLRDPFKRNKKHIGYYATAEEAHYAWKEVKHKYALELATTQTDERVRDVLMSRL